MEIVRIHSVRCRNHWRENAAYSQTTSHCNNPALANSFNSTGAVYCHMGEYFKALYCFEKALSIVEKTQPLDPFSLAILYSNIGQIYYDIGDYSKALSYHEQAVLSIESGILLPKHSLLGAAYFCSKNHTEASSLFKKLWIFSNVPYLLLILLLRTHSNG